MHYSDAIICAMASRLFTQPFVREYIKENIKAPRHWPLQGEFTGYRWIPSQRASNAENASIWWPHHVCDKFEHLSTFIRNDSIELWTKKHLHAFYALCDQMIRHHLDYQEENCGFQVSSQLILLTSIANSIPLSLYKPVSNINTS